jgi:hypothetical protein
VNGTLYIYNGRAGVNGIATVPSQSIVTGVTGAGHNQFPTNLGTAGDVNGDGYADVYAGNSYADAANVGAAYVYHGGPAGLNTSPATTWIGAAAGDYFGFGNGSAGDFNGDGFGDVVVGSINGSGGNGRVDLYLGASTGLPTAPSRTWSGPDGGRFGYAVATAGDINGDGYCDVIVSAHEASGVGRAYVYVGTAGSLPMAPSVTMVGTVPGGYFGQSVARFWDPITLPPGGRGGRGIPGLRCAAVRPRLRTRSSQL